MLQWSPYSAAGTGQSPRGGPGFTILHDRGFSSWKSAPASRTMTQDLGMNVRLWRPDADIAGENRFRQNACQRWLGVT